MRIVSIAILIAACAGAPPPRPVAEYPGSLQRPSTLSSLLGDAFALEQHVISESSEGRYEFRAVLQKRGDTLTLVGLGPHGGRGFVLTQDGDDVHFESYLPRELPFPPRYMLLDVQRAFFRGLGGVQSDGEHQAEIEGDEVREQWSQGRLQVRSYRRLDDHPPGLLRIEYAGGMTTSEPPTEVHLENGWFGYRLVIRTLSFRAIE